MTEPIMLTTRQLLEEVAHRMHHSQNSTAGRELGATCCTASRMLAAGVLNGTGPVPRPAPPRVGPEVTIEGLKLTFTEAETLDIADGPPSRLADACRALRDRWAAEDAEGAWPVTKARLGAAGIPLPDYLQGADDGE